MANDPATGPLSRDQFAALVAAPFGEATKAIRKHDPLYGRAEGETFEWRVLATITDQYEAHVTAATEDEANALADKLTIADFDWNGSGDDIEITSVAPSK